MTESTISPYEPKIAYGYLRRGKGNRVSVLRLQQRIMAHAKALGFELYRPIFVDLLPGDPLKRPGLRGLLNVMREPRIGTVITPSAWHLCQDDAEVEEVRAPHRSRLPRDPTALVRTCRHDQRGARRSR